MYTVAVVSSSDILIEDMMNNAVHWRVMNAGLPWMHFNAPL